MATATLVSVEEYLSTVYEPDCDYVDGVLEERNLGERDHSRLQALLIAYFFQREKQLSVQVLPEQRVQVSATRFRVPDLTLVAASIREQIITTAPLLCVEILSPEDRMNRVVRRAQEYIGMGVPDVWIIDPETRHCYSYTKAGLHESPGGILTSTDGRITLNIAEIGQ
jgi:Uma2 family endonuclease